VKGVDHRPKHFLWGVADGVATVTLNRPERKNPLTFDSYAEMRDTFRMVGDMDDVKSVVITGAGGNFCSGGDVHEIIGPLLERDRAGLREFTTMTGDLVIAMQKCPKVIVAAVDGVCVGAGAVLAMASDIRFGTARSRVAFLFVKVGLAGCDMGSCAMLPRIIGQGRAAELLYTGRAMSGAEALDWGFYNRVIAPEKLLEEAHEFADSIAHGPTRAHAMTKEMLLREWDMGVIDAINAEAEAQARCMETNDFRRAYEAFAQKQKPTFEGD
jgi:enoyl-CoA hydratase/carnithine racemase